MGVKDVFKKIGKVALTAAPYIAAPFTGGLSLAATGLANKAVSKWAESDAKKNVAKGLAPSKFDAGLMKAGQIGSMASMFMPGGAIGAFGKAASTAGKVGGALSNVQKAASIASPLIGGNYGGPKGIAPSSNTQDKMVNQKSPFTGQLPVNAVGSKKIAFGQGGSAKSNDLFNAALARGTGIKSSTNKATSEDGGFDWKKALGIAGTAAGGLVAAKQLGAFSGGRSDEDNRGSTTPTERQGKIQMKGARALGPSMNMIDQARPNLALSLAQGRLEGIKNQPFRKGYDVKQLQYNPETEEEYTTTSRMPRISPVYSNKKRQQQEEPQSRKARVR